MPWLCINQFWWRLNQSLGLNSCKCNLPSSLSMKIPYFLPKTPTSCELYIDLEIIHHHAATTILPWTLDSKLFVWSIVISHFLKRMFFIIMTDKSMIILTNEGHPNRFNTSHCTLLSLSPCCLLLTAILSRAWLQILLQLSKNTYMQS